MRKYIRLDAWYKVRIIYAFYGQDVDRIRPKLTLPEHLYYTNDRVDESTINAVRDYARNRYKNAKQRTRFINRICSEYWTGFYIVDKRYGRLAGIGWLLQAPNKIIWYDNLLLKPKEIRLCGMYVIPEYRGHGLGKYIQYRRIEYAFIRKAADIVTGVVESRRPAAMRLKKGINTIGTNYLIKIAGNNIISIAIGKYHKGIWYVGPGWANRRYHV